ncbi:hypothetical protein [Leptospira levettii]|uniref:hypothetical protein n=1 Tax=Leptospira levettii TaxID=2023178 RepID=UPI000C2A21DE|nr:hypothetical protein [Leptospira levettii]PJZ89537.1 hypothetical protein CH368_06150 [Leptospira levettii]
MEDTILGSLTMKEFISKLNGFPAIPLLETHKKAMAKIRLSEKKSGRQPSGCLPGQSDSKDKEGEA